jgi:aspartyl-tRNA(Asn)/glutamyl-tRNA(Gln) amidotransferase subunit C
MPVTFSRADVEAVARLANIELTEEEVSLFTRQLGDILEYARQLQEVDTTGVAPTASVLGSTAADRADEVVPSLDRREALANAPDGHLDTGLFRVPRVIG